MPVHEIMKFLESVNLMEQVEMLLALHCAPLLHGLKVSNLVKLTRNQSVALCHNIKPSGLSIWFLDCEKDENQVLLYRKTEMQYMLHQIRVQEVLHQFGYAEFHVIPVLVHLSEEMRRYKAGEREFPHELGVLLGYPIEDVLGFMENRGENYTYCGYWKVYGNIQQAKEQFAAYNKVREMAVLQVINGSGFMRQTTATDCY